MKKIFCSLLMAAIFLISSVAMAADEETLIEGADLSSIKTLAVTLPMHYKTEITEPNAEELADICSNVGSRTANFTVISYDDVVDNIWNDISIDIKALNDNELRKIFNENVAKYADAYVTVTTANNNKWTQFFFEVRDAKDGEMLYIYSIQNRNFDKDLRGYTRACEEFFKKFNAAIEKNIKDSRNKNK